MVQENSTTTPPPIMWAQRSGVVFLTVCLEDCKSPTITIEPNRVYFKGVGGTERREHEVDIQLYKEIDPEKSEKFVRDRNIEIMLKKREAEGGYWPHLTADRTKHHWLKVDFNRWRDEESSDEDEEMGAGGAGRNYDLSEMMGGLGAGDKPSLDELESDSDDEDIPGLV